MFKGWGVLLKNFKGKMEIDIFCKKIHTGDTGIGS